MLLAVALAGCADKVQAPVQPVQVPPPAVTEPPRPLPPPTAPTDAEPLPGADTFPTGVRVGMLVPLSGPNAALGKALLDAFSFPFRREGV